MSSFQNVVSRRATEERCRLTRRRKDVGRLPFRSRLRASPSTEEGLTRELERPKSKDFYLVGDDVNLLPPWEKDSSDYSDFIQQQRDHVECQGDGHEEEKEKTLPDPFVVLGIETSCDDTAVGILRSDGKILGEAIASQIELGEKWGGVHPSEAREAHKRNMMGTLEKALQQAGLREEDVDMIAVTTGPGLQMCLDVGCKAARDLALRLEIPFVGVHHMEAHTLSARLALQRPFWESDCWTTKGATVENVSPSLGEETDPLVPLEFPFLALLVSGGHSQLVLAEGVGSYSILGDSLDDALGEAYDKVARDLGLPVGGGGGPAVERAALEGRESDVPPLKRPLLERRDCVFSFAGLKSAVKYNIQKRKVELDLGLEDPLPERDVKNFAAAFQNTALDHVEERLRRAMGFCEGKEKTEAGAGVKKEGGKPVRSLVVVGGVAANQELRRRLSRLCAGRGSEGDRREEIQKLATREERRWRRRRKSAQKRGEEGRGEVETAEQAIQALRRLDVEKEKLKPWRLVVPPPRLCRDNGLMIAWAAVEKLRHRLFGDARVVRLRPRWPLGPVRPVEGDFFGQNAELACPRIDP
uniref:N(6)-L-threonylcarbamoyladenine synthase n=1 Tax=Chromera velia CCMP2878 TaxID=1169474 RepID=A0A0G4GTS1_9ALVE|eukprot:Cvel_23363.t1-p1 / transcript=Cvel_23363.t1 / gene=Cvel_23363 / organism=Chromera_velia_CCMP2878 / gene_product=Probable tRNA threonylcarbamoyladenosine, putative / transcript_product=Probable tRNA threonylcarbamoyladenosine, putative / location=Cvel_scaffold2398:19409-24026(-) / protein_length=584 / sequence_SO=supercontig / SO=protein_coding / is_pseudo=false